MLWCRLSPVIALILSPLTSSSAFVEAKDTIFLPLAGVETLLPSKPRNNLSECFEKESLRSGFVRMSATCSSDVMNSTLIACFVSDLLMNEVDLHGHVTTFLINLIGIREDDC